MRAQPFTLWTVPPTEWDHGETFQGARGGHCAVRGLTVLYRLTVSIIGHRHSLMVPHGSGTRTYLPARRAD